MPGGVIEHQQDLLAGQVITPQRRPGLQVSRDVAGPQPGGQQQRGQRIGGRHGLLARGMAVQRQEVLPVRVIPGQPVRGMHRERRLAHPGHSADGVNRHHPTAAGRLTHGRRQLPELARPAGEAGDVARQRADGRRPAGPAAGRQRLHGRGLPTRRRLEQLPLRPGQVQRVGQQPGGLLARGPVDPPLQITDRPRDSGSPRGQLFLRQPGIDPELAQQAGETQCRLLPHRRIAPSPPRLAANPADRQQPATRGEIQANSAPGILWVSCARARVVTWPPASEGGSSTGRHSQTRPRKEVVMNASPASSASWPE